MEILEIKIKSETVEFYDLIGEKIVKNKKELTEDDKKMIVEFLNE